MLKGFGRPSILIAQPPALPGSAGGLAESDTFGGLFSRFSAVKHAATYIRDLKPGEKAVVTCLENDKGVITSITHFKILKK